MNSVVYPQPLRAITVIEVGKIQVGRKTGLCPSFNRECGNRNFSPTISAAILVASLRSRRRSEGRLQNACDVTHTRQQVREPSGRSTSWPNDSSYGAGSPSLAANRRREPHQGAQQALQRRFRSDAAHSSGPSSMQAAAHASRGQRAHRVRIFSLNTETLFSAAQTEHTKANVLVFMLTGS